MIGKAVLMLAQVAILARLLPPSDFGLMALVASVIAFAQIFSDVGISNAIIHHQKISKESLSSLYWLNVLASTVLMLLLMLASPLIANWYHEPRLQLLLMSMSVSFLIVALGQQLRVIAEKNLRFDKLAVVELAASSLGLLMAVVVAVMGGGVFALVAGAFASAFFSTLFLWWKLAEGWRPMWRLKLGEIKEFLSFGSYMIGFSLTNTINIQADILIGGRVLSAASLGAYSLPKGLCLRLAMIINPIVTRVGLPVMAQVQGDRDRLKSIYLKTLLMVSSVNFPLYLFTAVFAPEVVAIMLGEQWKASVPLLQIFALWGLVRSTGNPAGSLVMAMGRANLMFWWSLGLMFFWLPIFWVGSQYGAQGLAISALVAMLAMPIPQWFIVIRPLCGANFVEYFKQMFIPLWISAVVAGIGYCAAIPFEMPIIRIVVGGLVGAMVYLLMSRYFNRAWFSAMAELLLGRERSIKYKIQNTKYTL